MALLTVEEADGHLKLDLVTSGSPPAITDERLPDLEMKIAQAEAAILDYIEMSEADLSASGVNETWLPNVKAATLLMLSALFEDREGKGDGDYLAENGAIARLLRRIRYPAIA